MKREQVWCCICGRKVYVLDRVGDVTYTSCAPKDGALPNEIETLKDHAAKVRKEAVARHGRGK